MTWDVNACARGCREGGAREVIVRDVHGTTFNLIWHELEGVTQCILGPSREGRMPGIESCDGLILLGYHAMAGTPMGVLEHTSNAKLWQNCWMNGEKAGELALDGGRAGDHDVPVIMVSGDDKTCEEAAPLFPEAVRVEVKKGLDIEGAMLLPMDEAHERIRTGAREAVTRCRDIPPYKVDRPVTLRLELVSRGEMPRNHEHINVIDGRTYEVSGDSVTAAVTALEHA